MALEALMLFNIRAAGDLAGVSLEGADLIPMRKHDNGVHFENIDTGKAPPGRPRLGLSAWTNSSQHIYVNLKQYVQRWRDLESGNPWWAPGFPALPSDQALKHVLAMFAVVLRHEVQHVDQFKKNQNKPPDTFEEMIQFEAKAYAEDVTWLRDPQNANRLIKLGAMNELVQGLIGGLKESADMFAALAKLATESDRIAKLKAGDFLPQKVEDGAGGTKANYGVADLYKTRTPWRGRCAPGPPHGHACDRDTRIRRLE